MLPAVITPDPPLPVSTMDTDCVVSVVMVRSLVVGPTAHPCAGHDAVAASQQPKHNDSLSCHQHFIDARQFNNPLFLKRLRVIRLTPSLGSSSLSDTDQFLLDVYVNVNIMVSKQKYNFEEVVP
jgi:hypothetical protein